jgi:Cu2+-exporting ATPase
MTAATTTATCLHCLLPVGSADDGPFCCAGCRAVYGLLHAEHLDRYYALRGSSGRAVADAGEGRRDHKWLDAVEARLRESKGLARVDLDVQGLHCTGCVWLVRELFRRHPGGASVLVNPVIGRAQITCASSFDVRAFVQDVERFGYLFGPPLKRERRASQDLVWRMGVCVAIAMNSMSFAVAIYGGLTSGPLFELFHRINLALAFASVMIGGSVFILSAWRGLRRGVLHLDLPIAIGILLAFAGSVHSYFAHSGAASFVDTLNVFIALMLVGRWLQQRVLEKNRLALLESDGVDGLLTRRRRADGTVETVRCTTIRAGDELLLAPGDVLPVDATCDAAAAFSLDWINGESAPRAFAAGERIPAGAFSASSRARTVSAATAFDASPLIELLRAPQERDSDRSARASWWQHFTKIYVVGVLVAAAGAFATWMLKTHDAARAAEVATAVLIVTCPCAFGIATPLANDLVLAGLRRSGLFVRAQGFLERAARVRTVVFDKTGTLTTGALTLRNPGALDRLNSDARAALYTLASSSHHPKSLAVRAALESRGGAACVRGEVTEHAGLGVELTVNGSVYKLGAPQWTGSHGQSIGDVAFGVDGRVLCELSTCETERSDAPREVSALRREGYDVWLLSGDDPARVQAVARRCGVDDDHAVGGQSPRGKADWAAKHDHGDLLMIGDGINDSLVVDKATCSGTPAVDRPFMAARSDFYFVSSGLSPIRLALRAGRALSRVRTRNLCIALAYNAATIVLAYVGVMSPLVCAIAMPVSSLSTIAATTLSLNARSRLWRF